MSTHDEPPIPSTAWMMNAPDRAAPAPINQPTERARRGPKMIPWVGCPLFSTEDLAEVPETATLGIRFAILWNGEKVPFQRKLSSVHITLPDILTMWGPATYIASLHDMDPSANGLGIRGKPLAEKTFVVTSRDPTAIGEQAWPVDLHAPETPVSMREEAERREAIRSGELDPLALHQSAPILSDVSPTMPHQSAYASVGSEPVPPAPPYPAPPGQWWIQTPTGWTLGGMSGGLAQPQAPQQGGGLAAFFAKDPEEILKTITGLVGLAKGIGLIGGGGSTEAAERIRQESENARALAQQAHDQRMEELRFQHQQLLAIKTSSAPVADAAAIEAKLRAEYLAKEVETLRQEARAAKAAPPPKPFDLGEELAKAKAMAESLGYARKGSTSGDPAPPTVMEQIADVLSTPGGRGIAMMAASKLLEVPIPADEPPPPAPPTPTEG